jgi:adenylate kinase
VGSIGGVPDPAPRRTIWVIFGPPGSGKGTQAELLTSALGVPHVSTGELLRTETEAGTPLGAEVAPLLAAGELAPDELIERVLERRLAQPDARRGAILDGYPRTVAQARSLDRRLAGAGCCVQAVLVLDVDEATLVERLLHRAGDQHRADDHRDAIAERMVEYRRLTEPVLAYYRDAAVSILEIDGTAAVDVVHERVVRALEELPTGRGPSRTAP